MALVKGLGKCLIQLPNGVPCGRQIQEGEPIGTVVVGPWTDPIVGHKTCADDYNMRKANMVKKVEQKGAGGAVDFGNAKEMVAGSIPLETPRGGTPPDPVESEAQRPELNQVRMPEGVRPLSDLPMEEPSPPPPPERNIYRDGHNPPGDFARVPERLTDHERQVVEAYRTGGHAAVIELEERLAAERVTHTITLDMSEIPNGVTRLQINLDWPQ